MFGAAKFSRILGIQSPGLNDIGSVVGPIVGGLFGSEAASTQADAASQAAATSAAAADKATQLQREMWLAQQSAYAPYRSVGETSLNTLAGLMGVTPYASEPEKQYLGMSRDQLRAALLPQYTTTVTTPSYAGQELEAGLGPTFSKLRTKQGGTTQSRIDEAALNARIDQILKQQQDYATAQKIGKSSDYGSMLRPFSMADYEADPGYAFRLSEGMKALEQGAAARGGLLSGNMLKGAQRYGQGLASEEYQNAYNRYQQQQGNKFNRLASLAGIGQSAVGALGQAGQNYASNVGNIGMSSGANQANALLAAGQSRASSLGGIGQALGGIDYGNFFKNMGIGGSPSYTSSTYQNMGGYQWNPNAYTLD